MRALPLLTALALAHGGLAFLPLPPPRAGVPLARARGLRRTRLVGMTQAPQDAKLNKGFRILELAGGLVPQGAVVKSARFAWKTIWTQMMRELAPQSPDGAYVRPSYGFRGVLGGKEFPFEEGRYHVYVGNACPWCHRVVLAIVLRGLTKAVSFSRMSDDPEKASRGGWAFTGGELGDPVFGCLDLREVYEKCNPGFKGRCTAPVVVDKKTRRIVNNESSQIVRMLNGFDPPSSSSTKEGGAGGEGGGEAPNEGAVDLCPVELEGEVDRINDLVYNQVNNGVYRAGFATSQGAYDKACTDVMEGLQKCEELLSKQRFLAGDRFTEADLRLLPTAVRFDAVYATLFKCSRKRIRDFRAIHAWLRDVYQIPGVAGTIDVDDARRSYFTQLFPLNPGGIVPAGPTVEDMGLREAADRGPTDRASIFHLRSSGRRP